MIPAVFDIDRTLIEGMSGRYFVEYLWQHRVYSLLARLRIVRAIYRFRRNRLTEADVVKMGALTYKGLEAEELVAWGRRCFDEVVRPKIYAEAFRLVRRHIRQGHHVVFASGSSNYIADPVGRHFGAHRTIGTRARVLFGRSTGEIENHICYGEGKLRLVETYLAARGMSLSDAYAYSDGPSDLPLLEKAGHPAAVNPSVELEEIAVDRGWPVFRWSDLMTDG